MNALLGLRLLIFLALMLEAALAFAGTPGSFRGFLMEGANTKPGWMYVQSRNNMLRLVRVKGARVFYAQEIPMEQRHPNPADSLRSGAEVRVTAEEDGHGRWHAEEIEILNLAPTHQAEK